MTSVNNKTARYLRHQSIIKNILTIMAELNVQPKKRKIHGLMWLLMAIVLLVIIIFLQRSCNDTGDNIAGNTSDSSATVGTTTPNTTTNNDTTVAGRTPGAGNWDDIDQNAPATTYDEIKGKDISVRGNDNYGIYSLGEDILFDKGKSTIRTSAAQNLKQIAASIKKRFQGGNVRVYGYTDSVGSTEFNKELAEKRAAAVGSWLAANGSIDSSHISLNPIGEGRPVASNSTEQGRQQNRRVEIIARKP
jgi:outer membrane protein OmpA-like peptidoglycan-associated protein